MPVHRVAVSCGSCRPVCHNHMGCSPLSGADQLPPPPCREGDHLPAMRLLVAFPLHPSGNQWLRIRLLDPQTGCEVAGWQPPQLPSPQSSSISTPTASSSSGVKATTTTTTSNSSSSSSKCSWEAKGVVSTAAPAPLVFQQCVAGPAGEITCCFGDKAFRSTVHELWVSPPATGAWEVQLQVVNETPSFMSLRVEGLPAPLPITLKESEVVARLAAIVPAPLPHDGVAGGPLPDASTPPAPLPRPAAAAGALALQLVSPRPDKPLEADRPERFEVAFGSCRTLGGEVVEGVLVGADGCGWTELEGIMSHGPEGRGKAEESGATAQAVASFAGTVVAPRRERCVLRARVKGSAAALAALGAEADGRGAVGGAPGVASVDLLSLAVLPQVCRCCGHGFHSQVPTERMHFWACGAHSCTPTRWNSSSNRMQHAWL